MQFQCSKCKEKFHYPAKLIQKQLSPLPEGRMQSIVWEMEPTFEVQVCPFCQSKTFTEYVEPEADITSVKSVPLEDVDAWLKDGYIVKELYAKTATLIKREVKFVNPDPDCNEAIIEANQQ